MRHRPQLPATTRRRLVVPQASRARARNAGVSNANGNLILFLDDDCIVGAQLLEEHWDYHTVSGESAVLMGAKAEVFTWIPEDAEGRDSVNAQVASFGLTFHDPLQHSFDMSGLMRVAVTPPWLQTSSYRAFLQRIKEGTSSVPWHPLITAHCSVSTRPVRAIGGFCEQFVGWGEEDLEFAYRLFLAGARFAVVSSPVYHQVHAAPESRWAEWLRNYLLFTERHPHLEVLLRWKAVMSLLSEEEYDDQVRASRDDPSAIERARSDLEAFVTTVELAGGLPEFMRIIGGSYASPVGVTNDRDSDPMA